MKRILLLAIISIGFAFAFAFSQIQAQNYEFIFPQYKEFVGYYATPSTGKMPIYYNFSDIKVKPNTTLEFDLSTAPFWYGCTNFTWYVNLPNGSTPVINGRDITVQLPSNTGWASISIDAIDQDGVTHRNCSFFIELTNNPE